MQPLVIMLFILGDSVRSQSAIKNLNQALESYSLSDQDYELTIVDLLETPDLAEQYFVLATPTLLKLSPLPMRRTIGDLSDPDALKLGLDLENQLGNRGL